MRRASKRDENEPAIVEALEAMGCTVTKIDSDDGFPDLVAGIRGLDILIEVKMPGAQFKPRQKAWHAAWRGRAHVAHSPQEAVNIVSSRLVGARQILSN